MDPFEAIEHEYEERERLRRLRHAAQQQAEVAPVMADLPAHATAGLTVAPVDTYEGMPLYPLALAQVPTEQASEPFLTRRVLGVPVWGLGLAGIAAAGIGGYFLLRKPAVKENGDEEEERAPRALPSGDGDEPRVSRGDFAANLRRFLDKNGIGSVIYDPEKPRANPNASTMIYGDADDAAKHLKHVSPLVTMKTSAKVPMKELEKFCKREGLQPIVHEDGIIGFYPAPSGKKGREWEDYVDALRDEGQQV